jgi:hypothetical protein
LIEVFAQHNTNIIFIVHEDEEQPKKMRSYRDITGTNCRNQKRDREAKPGQDIISLNN